MSSPREGKRRIIWRLPNGIHVVQQRDARSYGFKYKEAVPVPVTPTKVEGLRIIRFRQEDPAYKLTRLTGEHRGSSNTIDTRAKLQAMIGDILIVAPLTQFKVEIV